MSARDTDNRQAFLIESCNVRGEVVHLDTTWQDALARSDYPDTVRQVLGEAFAAAALLAGTVKLDGKMTLQIRGEGPVHLLVVQVTRDARLRGLARWQSEPEDVSLMSLFGAQARMIISIEGEGRTEPYQGIVPLEGDCLADALQNYFRTSEQLPTALWLAVDDRTAAGLLLQRLPAESADGTEQRDGPSGFASLTEAWQHAATLAATITDEELLAQSVSGLLHRLYHEERVRLFDGEGIGFECRCSRSRTDSMLTGLGAAEVRSVLEEQGKVEITCEFCNACYVYDSVDVEALFLSGSVAPEDGAPTRH